MLVRVGQTRNNVGCKLVMIVALPYSNIPNLDHRIPPKPTCPLKDLGGAEFSWLCCSDSIHS